MRFFSILTCLKTSEDLFQDLKQLTVSAVWRWLIVGSGTHNSIMGRIQLQHQVGIHLFVLVCSNLLLNLMAGFSNRSQHHRHLALATAFGTFFFLQAVWCLCKFSKETDSVKNGLGHLSKPKLGFM
jgi:hypothetical protein